MVPRRGFSAILPAVISADTPAIPAALVGQVGAPGRLVGRFSLGRRAGRSVALALVPLLSLVGPGCHRQPPKTAALAPAGAEHPGPSGQAETAPGAPAATGGAADGGGIALAEPGAIDSSGIRPLRRCFPDLPAWVDPLVSDLLDRALGYQEKDDFVGVLACAEEAARQAPRSVEAHHNRGLALMRLGRFDEARDALSLALAIAPDDGESLELAAELFINRLAPSAERTLVGLEYARRGRRSTAARHRARGARLALLEGQALVDLGRASEALAPLGIAEKMLAGDSAARYEQGVALFELCRFTAARRAFEGVLAQEPAHAHALYHLGLISEREGNDALAADLFNRASARDAKAFPPMPDIGAATFAARVQAVVARLPAEVRADLSAIPIETAELPSSEDLTAERPPLSPTILGLYRGLPIGRDGVADEPAEAPARGPRGRQAHDPTPPAAPTPRGAAGGAEHPLGGRGWADGATEAAPGGEGVSASGGVPARAIVLYRRNILRSLHGPEELDRAIERTLLHEVGHLRGEDDGSLRDRGLE
jgi:tetratricopeptide (TPR) repeat protein